MDTAFDRGIEDALQGKSFNEATLRDGSSDALDRHAGWWVAYCNAELAFNAPPNR